MFSLLQNGEKSGKISVNGNRTAFFAAPVVALRTRGIVMDNRKKTAQKQQQEDIALSRALMWFAAAMVLEFLLLLVNKYFINFAMDQVKLALALEKVLIAVSVLALLGAAACAVRVWKGLNAEGAAPFLPVLLTVALAVASVSAALVVRFGNSAMQLLYVLVPAGAVLALIYYLYQKEFFFSAFAVGVGLLGLWLVRKNVGTHDLLVGLYAAAGAVVLLALLVLMRKLKQDQGVLSVKGKKFTVLPAKSSILPVVLSCLLSLLLMAAGLLLGSTAAFYLLFVLLAWLFVLLVYYTVKLM